MQTTIPFSGFYESFHNMMIDDCFDSIFQDDSGWPSDRNSVLNAQSAISDAINWRGVYEEYAAEYAEAFERELRDFLGVKGGESFLTFTTLDSPKFYNFTTDRIFCEIKPAAVKLLYRKADRAKLIALVTERFTSRDGFASFYKPEEVLNNLESFNQGNLETLDHNEVGALLEAVANEFDSNASDSNGFDSHAEYGLMSDMSGNGNLDNMIWGNMSDKAQRVANYVCSIVRPEVAA